MNSRKTFCRLVCFCAIQTMRKQRGRNMYMARLRKYDARSHEICVDVTTFHEVGPSPKSDRVGACEHAFRTATFRLRWAPFTRPHPPIRTSLAKAEPGNMFTNSPSSDLPQFDFLALQAEIGDGTPEARTLEVSTHAESDGEIVL